MTKPLKKKQLQLKKQNNYSLLYQFDKDYLLNEHAQIIIGIDEAGRGPLAGPVVTASVILDLSYELPNLNDSKQLSDQQRRELFPQIKAHAKAYSVEVIDVETIDRLNILGATIYGMKRSFDEVKKQLAANQKTLVLVDYAPLKLTEAPVFPIKKGDSLSASIAAASILAKVTRDDIMIALHEESPHYKWDENKGYPTEFHREMIKKLGITAHHRRSFGPVKEALIKELGLF